MFNIFSIKYRLLYVCLFWCLLLLSSATMNAQNDKKFIRQGNREYEKNKYSESEVLYRKAINNNNEKSPDALFNIGDALYKQNKFEDAGKQFVENINVNEDKTKKSDGFYNLGNSLLKSNKVAESINAYKESLKLNPGNIEAKYNLGYAQDLLKQQQEQQKKDQEQNKGKENKQDQKQEDNQNQGDQDQKNEPQDQKDSQDQQQEKQQEQDQGMSKEDAERLLNAIANDEKDIQEKVKLEKAARSKVRTLKNW